MTFAAILSHVPDAVARLATQYQGAPTVVGLISALASRSQAVEDAIGAVVSGRLLVGGKTVGAQLDAIGTVVGLARNGLDDATYYVLLLGTVAKNYSDGTRTTLINLAQAIWQADAVYLTDPDAPGHARLEAFGEVSLAVGSPKTPDELTSLLVGIVQAALPGGVALVSVTRFDAKSAFACEGPQPWAAYCSDTAGAGGGALASLLYANSQA